MVNLFKNKSLSRNAIRYPIIFIYFVIFGILLVRGANLPTVGGDSDVWGTILNNYLLTEHDVNGSHTNITATGINVTGTFLINNASGYEAMSMDDEGNLNLNRGIILGNFSAKPSCTSDRLGMMVFDTVNNKPYVCANSNTWKPLDSDYDSDGLIDWFDSNDTSPAVLNATSADVRKGYVFVNNSGEINGTMDDCASEGSQNCYVTGSYFAGTSQTVSNTTTTQSAGYYAAFDLATIDGNLVNGNIVSGKTIFGVSGNVTPAGPSVCDRFTNYKVCTGTKHDGFDADSYEKCHKWCEQKSTIGCCRYNNIGGWCYWYTGTEWGDSSDTRAAICSQW